LLDLIVPTYSWSLQKDNVLNKPPPWCYKAKLDTPHFAEPNAICHVLIRHSTLCWTQCHVLIIG
jgi:hypothetical protein